MDEAFAAIDAAAEAAANEVLIEDLGDEIEEWEQYELEQAA